ncbi:MAG: HAD family hydrolase [Candidatus Dormibacteraceae bacterium]
MLGAILFDLDETLLIDRAWAEEALVLTCSAAGGPAAAARLLASAVDREARRLWREGPSWGFCEALGITWWEGLVSVRPGPGPEARRLAAWLPGFRRRAWEGALEALGLHEEGLATRLGDDYAARRRSRFRLLPEAVPLLTRLRAGPAVKLGMVTNGPADLQHGKLAATGLSGYFDAILVSGELGIGKPDAEVFGSILSTLAVPPSEAIMVGDSLARDVAGARGAGLAAIWLAGSTPPGAGAAVPDHVARDLDAVGGILQKLLAAP